MRAHTALPGSYAGTVASSHRSSSIDASTVAPRSPGARGAHTVPGAPGSGQSRCRRRNLLRHPGALRSCSRTCRRSMTSPRRSPPDRRRRKKRRLSCSSVPRAAGSFPRRRRRAPAVYGSRPRRRLRPRARSAAPLCRSWRTIVLCAAWSSNPGRRMSRTRARDAEPTWRSMRSNAPAAPGSRTDADYVSLLRTVQ